MRPSNPALRLQFSTEAGRRVQGGLRAYTADTGGSAGGQVSLIRRPEPTAFHGSVFDYLRNNYFDASRPPSKTSHKVPVFQLNQFGGSLGGPILKDRTFFFVNYEGFRQKLGGVPQTWIPLPSPSYRNALAAAQPALAFVVNAYPEGQAPTSDPNCLLVYRRCRQPDSENAGTIRLDHRFTEADSGYGRYNIDDGISTSALNALAQGITVTSRVQNIVLEETHILNPRVINEAQFGFNRTPLSSPSKRNALQLFHYRFHLALRELQQRAGRTIGIGKRHSHLDPKAITR